MRFSQRVRWVGTAAAAVATAAALSGAASATPEGEEAAKRAGPKSCPADSLCVWAGKKYTGKRVVMKGGGPSNKIFRELNNKVTSVKSRRQFTVLLYDEKGQQGDARCFSQGQNNPNLAGSYDFNNRASSSENETEPSPCV